MTKSKKILLVVIIVTVLSAISATVLAVIFGSSLIVTYDLNGGTMEETKTRVWFESDYTLPTPTREGYAFAGWYYGDAFVSTSGVWKYDTDILLKAKWEIRDENGIVYRKQDNGYVIESYKGAVKGSIVIPESYRGMPIIGADKDAFSSIIDRFDQVKYGFVKVYLPNLVDDSELLSYAGKLLYTKYDRSDDTGLVYLFVGDEVTVVGYGGNYKDNVTVPSTFDGKPVTAIGKYAFYGSTHFVTKATNDFFRIRIPESVKKIGESAFALCNGIKATLYNLKNGEVREIISKSLQFDWLKKAVIEDGNDQISDVIAQIRPAFGWSEYTNAGYYVRLNANGGTLITEIEIGKDADGKPVFESATINDIVFNKGSKYTLPVPTREGYEFAGWFYGERYIELEGSAWHIGSHIEIVAHWNEIQKEG